jgi:hypothetical protein
LLGDGGRLYAPFFKTKIGSTVVLVCKVKRKEGRKEEIKHA